jgi:hypothetical protein
MGRLNGNGLHILQQKFRLTVRGDTYQGAVSPLLPLLPKLRALHETPPPNSFIIS